MPRVMTTPTKQELRDTIKAQQETIEYLEAQLADNESLRDKLASKAAMADHLEKTVKEYREFHFKASCIHDLTAQLTLNDVCTILWMFRTRLEAMLWNGDDASLLEFADLPFDVEGGILTFVFEREQNQSTDS